MHHFKAIGWFKLELQSGNAQFGSKSMIWHMTLKNKRALLLCYFKLCASFRSQWWIQTGVTVRKRPIWVKLNDFFSRVTLRFDRWHWTRQIWGIWKLRPAYSPETPNLDQIGDVLSRVTLKFDGWPWKTIGHLSVAVSSFVQHFIAIGEFKLELLSGNAQFGSNSTIFRAVWPWNLTYDLEKQ